MKHRWQVSAVAAAAAAVWGLWAPEANALALGRVTVQSALGEPLRAEIDLPDINAAEAETLRAAAAGPDAFRAAGLEYNAALGSLNVSLQRRPDGRMFLRLRSDRPVNDPFMDLILEATWASGRIVRDYTMLFDPPSMRAGAMPGTTAPQISAPMAQSVPATASPASPPVAAPGSPAPAVRAPAMRPAPAVVAAPARPSAASPDGRQVTVKAGDTAGRIAAANKPANVSLDQMLVALLRANPDAFLAGNVNRIKAGAVLDLPSAEQAAALPAGEATQTVIAQSKDFNAFRRRLAGVAPTVQVAASERAASGKVQAQVDDRKPSTAAPDKLTLSKGAVQGKAAAEKAREGQSKDASTRVAELSKNITDLNKIGAAASASAPAAAAPAPAPAMAAPAASAPATPTVTAPVSVAPAPAAVASAPAEPAPPAAAPAASVPAPMPAPVASAPKPPVAVPAPQPEPSLVDSLMENPLIPGAAVALIALLAGFGIYRARQRKKSGNVDSSFLESRLQPDSFFGASGGQHVDTKDDSTAATGSSMAYSPSQLDAAGDVDPVAEADVYLAYGRDLQAEEILKEALRSNPTRTAIHAKLLEIYAKRQDVKSFETLATEAHKLTGGAGNEWERISELGREIDFSNPLYQPGGQPGAAAPATGHLAAGAAVAATAAAFAPDVTQPDFSQRPTPASAGLLDIDLDLDFLQPEPVPAPSAPVAAPARPPAEAPRPEETTVKMQAVAPSLDLDFDAFGDTKQAPSEPMTPPAAPSFLASSPAPLAATEPAPALPDISDGLNFSLDIAPEPVPEPEPSTAPAPVSKTPASDPGMLEFDLGSLTLDLDASTPAHSPPAGSPAAGEDDPLATKLALAEEFNAIGDADGARALVEEVIAEASGNLKTRAQRLLATLG